MIFVAFAAKIVARINATDMVNVASSRTTVDATQI